MQPAGDRGNRPNLTGFPPEPKAKKSPNLSGERAAKRGARQGTGKVAQKGQKKPSARTTKRSRDK